MSSAIDLSRARERMIEVHLRRRGIVNPAVLEAFRAVPREDFVPPELLGHAYDDRPLPIGEGQTISQPYIVALTAQLLDLRGDERVLEVGTGSGFAAAILGRLAREVYSVERIPLLAAAAEARLERLGHTNVHVRCADGTMGWPDFAPYQGIAVAAGGARAPPQLLAQMALGGRMVIPVGPDEASQVLYLVTRESEIFFRDTPISSVRFVPLVE